MDELSNPMDNGNSQLLDGGAPTLAVPLPDSPRTIWFRENRKMLDEKEEEEKIAKQQVRAKAQQYIQQFSSERAKRLEERSKANRLEEQQTVESGTSVHGDNSWDKIVSLINFNLGAQQKDTARFRSLLFQAREANLPLRN